MSEIVVASGTTIVDAISKAWPELSRSEARRLIAQSAVRIDEKKVTSHEMLLEKDVEADNAAGSDVAHPAGLVLRVGRRRFAKVLFR